MRLKQIVITLSAAMMATISIASQPAGKHFPNVMVVMFENMSYAEIKNEPTFKKLVEYTGNTLTSSGALVKMPRTFASQDGNGNGYAFFSNYYNNHSGGNLPSRTSQPNYFALTSGSVHHIYDNEMHDLTVDNLANELMEAGISWKVYADDLPDPSASLLGPDNQSIATHCNHYNLLKMIEANFGLRGLRTNDTSAGYKYAFPLDVNARGLWRS